MGALQGTSWCRNELCDRVELHLADHGCRLQEPEPEQLSKSTKPPWKRPASRALDHSIAKAVSKTYPKHLDAILREVEDDYGPGPTPEALYRAVQRHLAKLVERGQVMKIYLGRTLYAYLRPNKPGRRGSYDPRCAGDVELMRDQIEGMIESSSGAA